MLSIFVFDTLDGCAAYVCNDGKKLTRDQVAMLGILRWYKGGQLIATGMECKCSAGETVECRLEA